MNDPTLNPAITATHDTDTLDTVGIGENPVTLRLKALDEMSHEDLRVEWRRLYRMPPPKRVARNLLMLGIAWKIQEQAYGGLSAATKRRLRDMARSMESTGDIVRRRVSMPKPGAKLIREWNGEIHMVIVQDDGFEWNGRTWRSLTAIAKEITGTHWSGPRFFGLKVGVSDKQTPAEKLNG